MITSTIKIKTIGELLREKREEQGITLRQVSETTKIRIEYLQALEDGNYSIFPSEVYLKGFLKNYAKYLGINRERALALYRREHKILEKEQLKKSSRFSEKFRVDNLVTPERILFSIGGIVFALIAYYIFNQVSVILETPELNISAPIAIEAGNDAQFETENNTLDIKGSISADATLTINGDEVNTNNLNIFEVTNLTLQEGANEFKIIAESEFGRSSEIDLTVNKLNTEVETDTPEDTQEVVEITEMDLEIEIKNAPANVAIDIDGENKLNQVLSVGEKVTYKASQQIKIQSPRPTNLTITINNQSYEINTSAIHTWELSNGEVTQIQ